MSQGRKVSKASSRFLAKKRSPLFYGTDIPSTVSRKEIIDNELDVISERKMPAKQAVIKLSPRRLVVMDDGPGISTESDNGKETNLWLAAGELFTSSNYEGESDSVGNNGVGLSLGMLTSAQGIILNFNGDNVRGYEFINGLLKGTPEQIAESEHLENLHKNFSEEDELYNRIDKSIEIKNPSELDQYCSQQHNESGDVVSVELFEDVIFKGKFYTTGTQGNDFEDLLESNGFEFDQTKLEEFISKYSNNKVSFDSDDNQMLGYVRPYDEAFEGDYVSRPMTHEEAQKRFNPPYKSGFYVDVTWGSSYDSVFPDGKADLKWLHNYTKKRVGEMVAGGIVELYIYADDDFTTLTSYDIWTNQKELTRDFDTKDLGPVNLKTREEILNKLTDSSKEIEYIPSWLEQVRSYNAVVYHVGDYWVAFSTDENMQVDSIVQGAPVTSKYTSRQTFTIEDYNVALNVPTTFKYESSEYPPYSDQTKVRIKYPGPVIRTAFDKTNEVTKHFYREAELTYAQSLIQNAKEGIFWEALGKPEESELIIAEGFSAISGIKAQRNRETQACVAIQGKILNCWRSDIKYAMKSEEVKQILNAILYTPYKRIIFATDADPDGYHISTLLLGLLYQFTNKIQEGKVCYVNTPYYVFKKRGQEEQWSNDAKDCPKGYHVSTLKGLGSLTPEQVERFIINEDTRELIYFEDRNPAKSEEALDISLLEGGKRWILD